MRPVLTEVPPYRAPSEWPVPRGAPFATIAWPDGPLELHRLPGYDWEFIKEQPCSSIEQWVAVHHGVVVGTLGCQVGSREPHISWMVTGARVELRGRGVGVALYLGAAACLAQEDPTGILLSYGQRTSDAHRAWNRIIAAGIGATATRDPRDPHYRLPALQIPVAEAYARCGAAPTATQAPETLSTPRRGRGRR